MVAGDATLATGTAEREAATALTQSLPKGATLGADKNDDAAAFVTDLKTRGIVPHIAINGSISKTGKARKAEVPANVAASKGYEISQRCHKRIEEVSGWSKVIGGLAQLKVRGLDKVRAVFVFALAACNRVRLPKLLQPTGEPTGEVCPASAP